MYLRVTTAVSSKEEAIKIAQALVNEKLAACVQIINSVESHYIWQSKKETVPEYLLLIKTKSEVYDKLEQIIKSLHSYKIPEIIATPILQGSKEYLDWIDKTI